MRRGLLPTLVGMEVHVDCFDRRVWSFRPPEAALRVLRSPHEVFVGLLVTAAGRGRGVWAENLSIMLNDSPAAACAVSCALALWLWGCTPSEPKVDDSMIRSQRILAAEADATEGRRYALQYCQSCHVFVEPATLPRFIWEDSELPQMGSLLGMHHAGYRYPGQFGRSREEAGNIRAANVYPDRALVPTDHWDKLVEYIVSNAPSRRLSEPDKPPSYVSSSFDLYDFNNDGHMDILATNGDNGDHLPVLKRFHGTRIYLNDGANGFEERYFFPMNGAFKAMAEDFDEDGDLDIVAIAAFADYAGRPEEGFVYLENRGELQFDAFTVPQVDEGRWLTMDVGDLDGDGDKDVVIGAYTELGGTVLPRGVQARWDALRRPVLFLENQQRSNAAQ